MGIDYASFERLAELATRFRPEGRTLMLGRQHFRIHRANRNRYDKTLKRLGFEDLQRFDLLQEDGFSETLFRKLGFGEIESMDFSSYEGAHVLHDLNTLPPPELQNQFNFIYDGGTIEHVFHIPNALESVYRMLKPGGRFLSINGFNGWYGHGMYQFNPELVWTFWRRACNCEVIDCRSLPFDPKDGFGQTKMSDPAQTGVRLKLKNRIGPGRVYLSYEIEKTEESHLPDFALQSDYETRWQGAENAGATRFEKTGGSTA